MTTQLRALQALYDRLPTTDTGKSVGAILHELKILAEAVEHHRANPDSMKSEKANGMVVEAARARLAEAIQKARIKIDALVDSETKAIDNRQTQRANLIPDEFAAEIRQVYRGLNDKERIDYLKGAVDRGDGAAVAAIINAPTSVTGLAADRAAAYRTAFLGRNAPVDRSEVGEIQSIADSALRTVNTL